MLRATAGFLFTICNTNFTVGSWRCVFWIIQIFLFGDFEYEDRGILHYFDIFFVRCLFELGQLIHQLVLFVRELLHTLRELAVVLLRETERGLQVSLFGV